MKRQDFSFDLPPELIARHPCDRRDASRLLVLSRQSGKTAHRHFHEITQYLSPGDCLVVNDSRVLPARIEAHRPGGGQAELLLIEPRGEGRWLAMGRPARKLKPGLRLEIEGGAVHIETIEDERTRIVRFEIEGDLASYLAAYGAMPLPPYILHARRDDGEPTESAEDRERYQTVYARASGSVAAPTAGLHFTEPLLDNLAVQGVDICRVTLHVGLGTFEPVEVEDIETHKMHHERFAIATDDAERIETARNDPARRVIAVGTTSVRTLEACFAEHGAIRATTGSTDIFIHPGYRFGVIDGLITNFHLPESTLLMLISAFAGRERVLAAYAEAIRQRYRFYSYGDAMLIL